MSLIVSTGMDALFKWIPESSKKRLVIASVALALENGIGSSTDDAAPFLKDVLKSVQIISCLGTLRLFQPYQFYVPAVVFVIFIRAFREVINEKVSKRLGDVVNVTAFSMDFAAKTINSFALGLAFDRFFFKNHPSNLARVAVTAMALWASANVLRTDHTFN